MSVLNKMKGMWGWEKATAGRHSHSEWNRKKTWLAQVYQSLVPPRTSRGLQMQSKEENIMGKKRLGEGGRKKMETKKKKREGRKERKNREKKKKKRKKAGH